MDKESTIDCQDVGATFGSGQKGHSNDLSKLPHFRWQIFIRDIVTGVYCMIIFKYTIAIRDANTRTGLLRNLKLKHSEITCAS